MIVEFGNHSSVETLDEAKVKFQDFKTFLTVEKPRKTSTKLDLEASFVNIQTNLRTKGRVSYTPPAGLATEVGGEASVKDARTRIKIYLGCGCCLGSPF